MVVTLLGKVKWMQVDDKSRSPFNVEKRGEKRGQRFQTSIHDDKSEWTKNKPTEFSEITLIRSHAELMVILCWNQADEVDNNLQTNFIDQDQQDKNQRMGVEGFLVLLMNIQRKTWEWNEDMKKSSKSFEKKIVETVRRRHVWRTNLEMKEQANDYTLQARMSNISQRTKKRQWD